MKLIIEDYPYKAEDVENILHGIEALRNKDGRVRVDYVGYFYNTEIQDCVFFLPKVVINECEPARALGKYSPEDIIDVEGYSRMEPEDKAFIYSLSAWIYRAVKEYQRLKEDNDIVYQNTFSRIDGSNTKVQNTLLDVILSMIEFNQRNKDFFLFKLKSLHSGYNRINWQKTISSQQAYMQHGRPIYLEPINRKKEVNYDEELIVIFYSILYHVSQKYGFRTNINFNFELITGSAFDKYLYGYGKARLRQIKYKYFADRELMMWRLCYDFFELTDIINSSTQDMDYLLVKKFNIVFEAMIDELLSDAELKSGELADQPDGKIVDHIYAWRGLINREEDVYYIGDSKYYKFGSDPGKMSVYKQFTYARNVIQYNIGLFLDKPEEAGKSFLIYRDEATEGYNITPNFFISALLDKDYNYSDDRLTFRKDVEPQRHFENRLFDRDTLLLQHYDINFLFVLSLYASGNSGAKESFRIEARERFRKHVITYLESRYQFFSLQKKTNSQEGMEQCIDKHFREIIGKTFRPYNDRDILYLSCETKEEYQEQNLELISKLSEDFIIRDYKLGTDPRQHIEHYTEVVAAASKNHGVAPRKFTYADFAEEVFLFGGYRSDKGQKEWIDEHDLYNVRHNATRSGTIGKIRDVAVAARFLVLYEIGGDGQAVPQVYLIASHTRYSQLAMQTLGYPEPHGSYLVYRRFAEVEFDGIDLQAVLEKAKAEELARLQTKGEVPEDWEEKWIGTPIYYKGKELL